MENLNNGFDSSQGRNKSNNENELNPEMTSKKQSPRNKQLPTKNFMNPTISAQIKASIPRKKILGERNETLDTVEPTRLQRSSSFGSRSVENLDDPCLEPPYDPVKNYLSPRPKFLRYNPDRRRKKILVLQENDEDRVKISTYFNAGNHIPSSDSCSQPESVKEAQNVKNEEEEEEEEEAEDNEECEEEEDDDDDEMVEFGEDSCCSLKGFLKLLFVVVAVILTTKAICSMKPPSVSQTLESVWGVSDWHYGVVHGLNFSEVSYGPIDDEPGLLVEGELNNGDAYGISCYNSHMSETHEVVVVQDAKTDDHDDDSNILLIQDEILDYAEAETVYDDFNQESGLTEEEEEEEEDDDDDDSETNESNPQFTNEEELEVTNDMEDFEDQAFDDTKTEDLLIKFTTSFDPTIAVITGHILVLTSFSLIYCSKSSISTEENHSTNSSIQTAADSYTIKKQRRKNAEAVTTTPLSSVRRSSRLRTRSVVMSP